MEKIKLPANHVELNYEDRGSGEAVVLLHGFCGSSQYWKHVIPLLETSYRVIAPDLRGHGQSSIPEEPYLMETMAYDISQLLDSLGLNKVVMFGHSMGGYAAAAFAGAFPDKLAGVSLIHSTTLPDDEAGKQKRTDTMKSIQDKGIVPFVEGLIPKLFAETSLVNHKDEVEQMTEIGRQTPPQGAIRSAEGMRERTDRSLNLSRASFPVLLVAGAKDNIVSPEKTFSVEGSHVTKQLLEEAGHMSMIECPDKLAENMKTFLRSCYSR